MATQASLASAGVRIGRWPGRLASRGLAALHPALWAARRGGERRRQGGGQEQGRNVLVAAWLRSWWPPRWRGVDLGWVGRAAAAPVLGPDPAVTGAGAGRPGPPGLGGGRGPGPPGSTGGCWPRWSSRRSKRWSPPSTSRWLPLSATFSTFTAGVSPWCSHWTRPGAASSPGSGDSRTATSTGGAASALRRRVRVALSFAFRAHIRGLVPASDVNWLAHVQPRAPRALGPRCRSGSGHSSLATWGGWPGLIGEREGCRTIGVRYCPL
jgi:hypothetical protein